MTKKRLLIVCGAILLAITTILVAWQGSFNLGRFGPSDPGQTFIFWAVSTLIFVLMVTLGFMLFRELVKLWVARQSNREGSRIRTKLVLGALTLSAVPVLCLVLFSYEVLSHSLNRWFANPVDQQVQRYIDIATLLNREMQDEVNAQAALLGAQPETRRVLSSGVRTPGFLERFVKAQQAESAAIFLPGGTAPVDSWGPRANASQPRRVQAHVPVADAGRLIGNIELTSVIPVDVTNQISAINMYHARWTELHDRLRYVKVFYTMLMILITLFVLFVATWIAFFLARQISVPISALLDASREVRRGHFKRVDVRAIDELGTLVHGFNQMTEELEASGRELDRRRRFTEAILESIPTGVISIGADGSIRRVNRALGKILPAEAIGSATRLEDLFSREDTAEIKHLMKRARRTGTAGGQLELRTGTRNLHLAVTVSALEEKLTSGFVIVLEDTSELLRAQKAAAWHEVARRVAHEIKNPLTPIALSAERIARQLARVEEMPEGARRIVGECVATITKSVDSVKTLVDEFSRFARFPSAQLARCDLNTVVEEALAVFKDRLDGIAIQTSLAPGLPAVNLDREQFQRVVVNLVDNAAEAMQDSLVKTLYIATQPGAADTVELVIADTGCGIGPDDKERLFLPYFSTKNRGTGLGLAIVSHIVAEHNAQIRVEDNRPVGARFTVEIPVIVESDAAEAIRPAAVKV